MLAPAACVQISFFRDDHGMFAAASNLLDGVRKRHDLRLASAYKLAKTQLTVTPFAPRHELSTLGEAHYKVPAAANLSRAETLDGAAWVEHTTG